MATDINIVVPADMGTTIKLGAKEEGKFDVDLSQLIVPASPRTVRLLSLSGTVIGYIYDTE